MTPDQHGIFEDATPSPPSPVAHTLDEWCAIAKSCEDCGLSRTRTNVAFSDGNPEAILMIIGEGPGEHEDKQGIPFVGRAGQLLTKIIESVGLDRQKDTYIANIVKCRPPGNRVPSPEEAAACIHYLRAQVELVNPKIILLAGATALTYYLGVKTPISKVRGQWMTDEAGRLIMPIFHPSYLLRNDRKEAGSPKWLMWQDIKTIRQKFDELGGTPPSKITSESK